MFGLQSGSFVRDNIPCSRKCAFGRYTRSLELTSNTWHGMPDRGSANDAASTRRERERERERGGDLKLYVFSTAKVISKTGLADGESRRFGTEDQG